MKSFLNFHKFFCRKDFPQTINFPNKIDIIWKSVNLRIQNSTTSGKKRKGKEEERKEKLNGRKGEKKSSINQKTQLILNQGLNTTENNHNLVNDGKKAYWGLQKLKLSNFIKQIFVIIVFSSLTEKREEEKSKNLFSTRRTWLRDIYWKDNFVIGDGLFFCLREW